MRKYVWEVMDRSFRPQPRVRSGLCTSHMWLCWLRQGGRNLVMSQAPWSNTTGTLCVYRMQKSCRCSHTSNLLLPTASLAGVSFGVGAPELATPTRVKQTFQLRSSPCTFDPRRVPVPGTGIWLVTIDAYRTISTGLKG